MRLRPGMKGSTWGSGYRFVDQPATDRPFVLIHSLETVAGVARVLSFKKCCHVDLAANVAKLNGWALSSSGGGVYSMRMSRVNITVPDDVAAQARAAGLNVSRVATAALVEELDRRARTRALDLYLSQLDDELGPISAEEQEEAAAWADRVLAPASRDPSAKCRRSA